MELRKVSTVAIISGLSGKTKLCVRSPRLVWRPLTLAEIMDRCSILLAPGIVSSPDTVSQVSRGLVWVQELTLDRLEEQSVVLCLLR